MSRSFPPIFILLVLSGLCMPLRGQFFETGQDPASVRWKQINTPSFRLIFPEEFTENAQRLSGVLEYSYDYTTHSLNWKPSKIPVLIHNLSAESNGLVAWAPKRMELFTTPPQQSYPHDWLEQLALHEYRHVVQVDKLDQGMTRWFSRLTGEQLPGALSGSLRMWFLEGDATLSETLLSRSGRGRLPSFEMELRTKALGGEKFFTYDESLFGSYKKYVPDHYQFGYQMVAYSRYRYGSGLWDRAVTGTARRPYLVNPVHFSLKKETGLNKRDLYRATFEELKGRWTGQDRQEEFTAPAKLPTAKNRHYTSYRYPVLVQDSLILALKSGIGQIDALVLLGDDREETVYRPGWSLSHRLSASGPFVAWDELVPDARWSNRSFSVIKVYDLESRSLRTLTQRSRLYAPDISPDQSMIAAVQVSTQNRVSLEILGMLTGKTLASFPSPGNVHLQFPRWMGDNQRLLMVYLGRDGKGIIGLDTEKGDWKVLTEASFEDISSPVFHEPYVIFQASYSGIENIYASDLNTGRTYRITSSRFGAFDPLVTGGGSHLVYSDYSPRGFAPARMPLDTAQWVPLEKVHNGFTGLYSELLDQEKGPVLTGEIPVEAYPVKKYRRWTRLFRFHSWLPFWFDLESFDFSDPGISPGVTLFSQNTLGTALSTLGYSYREGEHFIHSKFSYKGWYPVIEFGYDYGGAPFLIKPVHVSAPEGIIWKNSAFVTKLSVPLDLTRNRFIRGTIPMADFNFHNYTYYNLETGSFEKNLLVSHLRLYDYLFEKTSHRDLAPRLGRIFDLNYSFVPFAAESFNPSWTIKTVVFIPGIVRHHSLRFEGGMQQQNLEKFAFPSSLSFPRGTEPQFTEKLEVLSADYAMPLFYPDFQAGGLLFVKRFRAGLFGDYARNRFRKEIGGAYFTNVLTSFGGSLSMDYHLLRIPYMLSSGVRAVYVPSSGILNFELLFNINIYGFNINRW